MFRVILHVKILWLPDAFGQEGRGRKQGLGRFLILVWTLKILFGCTGTWLLHMGSVVLACQTLTCSMWDLVPAQGSGTGPCIASMES